MSLFKKHKKSILIVIILVVLIFLINIVVSSIIKKKITEVLLNKNSESHIVSIEKVRFELLSSSVTLKDISYIPTDQLMSEFKNGKYFKNSLQKFTVSSIKLDGIGIIKLLFNKNIDIHTLNINGLTIDKITNPSIKEKEVSKSKPLNLDSIYLKDINGFEIRKIKFSDIKYQIYDITSDKITFQTSPISFQSSGFVLENVKTHLFRLALKDHEFKLNKFSIDFENEKYRLSIDQMTANFEKKLLNIKKISLKPSVKRDKLAKSYKFTSEIFNVEIEDLNIHNYDLSKTLKNEGVFIDSVAITGLNLEIYKDKRKPFDTNKRPVLINYKLKKMEN